MMIENFKIEYGEHDPDEIVDILNISTSEILDRFEDKIEDYLDNQQPEANLDESEET